MESSSLAIGIIGAGSWGTTLATLLAYNGHKITIWVYEKELYENILKHRENHIYLPNATIPDSVIPTQSFSEASQKKDLFVSAVPSHLVRPIITRCVPYLDCRTTIVSVSKGIENDTLKSISSILKDILPKNLFAQTAYLSGPSFAKEVAKQLPTAIVAASEHQDIAREVQKVFATPFFRVYTSNDVKGVELGGALKNVIALAAGCSDGLGFGHNTRAAIITRGLAEISRLGVDLGANPLTFSGLSGLGDLVLTCTGALSRNRSVGVKLGKGMFLEEIIKSSKMVAEGIKTTKSAFQLAQQHGVEMPIVEQVYQILYHKKDPRKAVTDLMGRTLRYELDKNS
ncbi:MAG: NAD(P)-dependent glycerol-3-phosphate dehydrogenase [Deltaproteobacteria bacterium]|nr:NAD(P)-dependent glycerol-3-phosphate dehydrogenase [Deltaproteobacteria bacterium]